MQIDPVALTLSVQIRWKRGLKCRLFRQGVSVDVVFLSATCTEMFSTIRMMGLYLGRMVMAYSFRCRLNLIPSTWFSTATGCHTFPAIIDTFVLLAGIQYSLSHNPAPSHFFDLSHSHITLLFRDALAARHRQLSIELQTLLQQHRQCGRMRHAVLILSGKKGDCRASGE